MTHAAEAIPQRPALPLVGNEINIASGLDLVTEPADESRFRKNGHADLVLLREIGGDGLFTAFNDEPNWRKAHDVLLPAFSLGAMRGCRTTMLKVARELIAKWDAATGTEPVDVAEDMTRLTFGMFHGIGSHFLQTVTAGDTLRARVLPCGEAFRLPDDPDAPVIPVSAGTGLAPFRGAVLARHHARSTGTLLCYFGCDHPDVDYLHRAEFEAAEAAGAVSMRPSFSCAPEDGVRFVQDRIRRESDEVWAVLEAGGRVHVCGDGRRMAPAVREAFMAIHREHTGADEAGATAWLSALTESGHHVEDVWAG